MQKSALVAKKLTRARKATERARAIIEKLMLYARDSGPEMQTVEPAALVSDAAGFLEHQLAVENVALETDVA
ncbi:hypothetical protein ABTM28_21380, partial [Acinetobacter baumannii]